MKFSSLDFQVGWRLLFKEPIYSAVVLLGLAVGIAVFYLLTAFLRQSSSYDRHFPQPEQLYVVKTQFNYNGPDAPWKQFAPQMFKQVLDNSGLDLRSTGMTGMPMSLVADQVPHEVQLTLVHPDFPEVFGTTAIEGDLKDAIARPDALAVTSSLAYRLFNTDHAVGRTVRAGDRTLSIVAILKDPPATSSFSYEAIVGSSSTAVSEAQRERLATNWGLLNGSLFVRLAATTSPEAVERVMQDAVDHSPLMKTMPPELISKLGNAKLMRVRLGPLIDAYLDPQIQQTTTAILHGDVTTLRALAAVAALILLLSITNYVNLATVRTLARQREIALRKVMGASVGRVIAQFIAESLLVSGIATVLGLLLAFALRPIFSELVDRRLDNLFAPDILAFAVLIGVLAGVLSGAYPAWVALKVRASQSLSGRGNHETVAGLWLRRLLTIFQFGTAMALCAMSIAITWQTDFATRLDPGFDPEPLIILEVPKPVSSPEGAAFRDALAQAPEADGVTAAWDAVGQHRTHLVTQARRDGGEMVSLEIKGVRPDFFEVYRVQARAGRLFESKQDNDEGDAVVINASAATAMGFASPEDAVGKHLTPAGADTPARIVGIAPEMRFESLRQVQEPLLYALQLNTQTLTVRARDRNTAALQQRIEQSWPRYFPSSVLRMTPAKSFFDLEYADERRMSRTMTVATTVAFLIAAFGIYVLAAYSVQRRSREIVLRKLHGARSLVIGRLVCREFLALVAASALLALPIAALGIQRFMSIYLEHAPIGVWPLAMALALALAVALVSTTRHLMAAMRISPAVALRG